jgi:hypothetical protein
MWGVDIFFLWCNNPSLAYAASLLRFRDHTQLRHTTFGRTPLDEGSARRGDLYLIKQNISQKTDIHASSGIQTRNPSKREASKPTP